MNKVRRDKTELEWNVMNKENEVYKTGKSTRMLKGQQL